MRVLEDYPNLDDDEVTISRLEEVVVPLHLDLHLVLHPVDLQKINNASFSDLTLFAFLTTSKWVWVSPLALVARLVGDIVTPPLIENLTNSLIWWCQVKRKQHVHVLKWSMYIYVTKWKISTTDLTTQCYWLTVGWNLKLFVQIWKKELVLASNCLLGFGT